MEALWASVVAFFTSDRLLTLVRALSMLVGGMLLARLLAGGVARLMQRRGSPQYTMMARRGAFYTVAILTLVSALRELGFDLSVLLGAAGILTVAVGFASQTSASNLISGLFLLAERPFIVGDVIRVGDTTGEVLAVDLLSVKLRTFDNLYVRVPNETLVKSLIVNLTHFPIRRIDVKVGVSYREDLARVRAVLLDVADRNPLCLAEPVPFVLVLGFGESSVDLQLSVWSRREGLLELRSSLTEEVKRALDAEGISIPFPHRTLQLESPPPPLPEPQRPRAEAE